jgi:RNA polymerase sigma-70 factor (ECF subfamily)
MYLPEDKRELLVLSRFQELKYDEIARLLGCEVGAIKVRIHRALQQLRQVFLQLESGAPATDSNGALEDSLPRTVPPGRRLQ